MYFVVWLHDWQCIFAVSGLIYWRSRHVGNVVLNSDGMIKNHSNHLLINLTSPTLNKTSVDLFYLPSFFFEQITRQYINGQVKRGGILHFWAHGVANRYLHWKCMFQHQQRCLTKPRSNYRKEAANIIRYYYVGGFQLSRNVRGLMLIVSDWKLISIPWQYWSGIIAAWWSSGKCRWCVSFVSFFSQRPLVKCWEIPHECIL